MQAFAMPPKATLLDKVRCFFGFHKWYYSDSQPWRGCGKCKKEQTLEPSGYCGNLEWHDSPPRA
jgi:hypothetical protein